MSKELDPTVAQVLHGVWTLGPYVHCPHYTSETLAFYRAMVRDGLVTEAALDGGRVEFTITPKGAELARVNCDQMRERLQRRTGA